MSVPMTTSPETGQQQARSHVRRCLTATVASAVIAVGGIAIGACGELDASRQPSSEPSTGKGPVQCPKPRCWWFRDPRVVKGCTSAMVGGARRCDRVRPRRISG